LRQELEAFSSKTSARTGHESFEAWRERDHDDIVLSLALALWAARRAPRPSEQWAPVKLGREKGDVFADVQRGLKMGIQEDRQPDDWLSW
jgi:hypothetical protein